MAAEDICCRRCYDSIRSITILSRRVRLWKSALRVRALHGRVRRRLLRRQEPHAGEDATDGSAWDIGTYGVPINQEDMANCLKVMKPRLWASTS